MAGQHDIGEFLVTYHSDSRSIRNAGRRCLSEIHAKCCHFVQRESDHPQRHTKSASPVTDSMVSGPRRWRASAIWMRMPPRTFDWPLHPSVSAPQGLPRAWCLGSGGHPDPNPPTRANPFSRSSGRAGVWDRRELEHAPVRVSAAPGPILPRECRTRLRCARRRAPARARPRVRLLSGARARRPVR
jgi:hypothetical protein